MTINWRILAVTAVILITAFAVLLIMNANLRASVAIARTESAALHIDNAGFKAKVEQQNKAIAAYEAAEAARMHRAVEAEKTARKLAARYHAAADELLNRKMSGDDCAVTNELINRYVRENP